MSANPDPLGDPAPWWRLQPLSRAEVPLACALVAAVTEHPDFDVTLWRETAQRWLASRSARMRQRIMTLRNPGGLIFALFFCADERRRARERLFVITGLRVVEPAGGRHALEAVLDAIERLVAAESRAGALIRADKGSRTWDDLASGLEAAGPRRGWHRHGNDTLTGGPGRDTFAYYARGYDRLVDNGADTITFMRHFSKERKRQCSEVDSK